MNFSENIDLFLEEALGLLAKIETGLIELEKSPGDQELINEVFRGLHTIKGSGAMFGFASVASFTHLVENLFDEVRQGKLTVTPAIIDIGLRAGDGIARLLKNPELDEAHLSLLRDIEKIDKDRGAAVPAPQEPVAAVSLLSKASRLVGGAPLQSWRITIKPQVQILNRGVKIESLFRELAELGTCRPSALTDEVPNLEQLDPTSLFLSWSIVLSTTANLAGIRAVFLFVEDYMELAIEPLVPKSDETTLRTPKLGEILVSRGQLNPDQVKSILSSQKPFGEAAISQGLVKKEQVEAALAEQTVVRTANTERESRQESATIRVRKDKLDGLIDLVGELVILQAILELKTKKDSSGVFGPLSETLARLAADLRDTTMSIRMVPLEESFASFHRLVRDLSQTVGKELRLKISGGSTELDKNITEALKDPLVHIIRNTADHGIESAEVRRQTGKDPIGTISIGARQVGSRVEITVSDDGAGLNVAKIKARAVERKLLDPVETDEKRILSMIFEPGFSTVEKTTSLSGRGVGMDVVKRNIEKLRGEVSLQSVPGRGLTVTLSIPLTLVIIEGLLVHIGGSEYVISLAQVQECVDLTADIQVGSDQPIINLRGRTIPVLSLRQSLGILHPYEGLSRLVIVQNEGAWVGLMVDAVVGRKQVVIKPLSNALRPIKVLSGATILGDGSVALILDVAEIVKKKLRS